MKLMSSKVLVSCLVGNSCLHFFLEESSLASCIAITCTWSREAGPGAVDVN